MGKLSGLPPNTTPVLGDLFAMIQAGGAADVKVTLSDILVYAATHTTNPYKFSVYQTGDVAMTSGVWTKAALNTKRFDTGGNFDATTNFRFTAPIAGFYQINAQIGVSISGYSNTVNGVGAIYKNGVLESQSTQIIGTANANTINRPQFGKLYQLAANDYIELYANIAEASRTIQGSNTWITGFLVSGL